MATSPSDSTRNLRTSVISFLPTDYAEILLDNHNEMYRKVLGHVVYLGFCFSIVFTSNIVQSFLTTLYPNAGFISLALTQFFFATGSLIAPAVGNMLGVRTTMFIGSFTYALLMGVVNLKISWLLIVVSAINGIGAGFLWICQGVWLTRITHKTGNIGTFTGIFFTLFNMSGIVGNVITLILQYFKIDLGTIIWIMTGLALTGSVMICFSTKPEEEDDHHHSTHSRFQSVVRVAKLKQTLLLMPYIVCQGLSLAFSAGNLPIYAEKDEKLIVFILLSFGLAATITSFVCGKVFDRFGMVPLLIIHVMVVISQYSLLILFVDTIGLPEWISLRPRVPSWIPVATLIYLGATFGLLDFLINTIINVSISHYYDKRGMPSAFSIYRFVSCLGFAGSAAISPVVSDLVIAILNVFMCFLSIICYWLFLQSVSEYVRMSIRSGRFSHEPLFGDHSRTARFSVASVACIGPARPSVVSFADVIAEALQEEEEEDDDDE